MIDELGEQFSVNDCCRVFEVSRSSFYAWRQRQGKVNPEREKLKAALVKHHKASRASAGSRTLSKELQANGYRVGRFMARSLMREAGIVSRQRRRHKYKSSGTESLVAPHVLKREFDVSAINQVWCGDVTYIQVGKRWLYFAAVLDLFARRIVGWSFSMTSDAELVCEALRMAVELRGHPKDVLFHSDQGCQYTSHKFRNELLEHGHRQSMSRKGECWDDYRIGEDCHQEKEPPQTSIWATPRKEMLTILGFGAESFMKSTRHLVVPRTARITGTEGRLPRRNREATGYAASRTVVRHWLV
ncbi:Integrase core domain protein [compost metagenome]